ncbi:hypothetical protein PLIIFM63780_000051 [Purpureocillium lilacinum]|uniref:Transcriptional regulator family: Fungal Specific TF n=2 Tax=Purpureocillium lilacinum TaxID=33203 RepID=A0A2U3DX60_PURLI|nr:transcriptional regulator family: Fungal Specific TF [Purpureocillium lilacinum]PWI66843.1 hypothetical protein PCL_04687 [Purpureocillium lilacinum]GJN69751.1 hypothetical protein PLICBS_003803 [Purpureocillium lilacinum]GJN76567.1 hypothetical protein PLIIFM63780_000051 [Purpureocillium lilacinum]
MFSQYYLGVPSAAPHRAPKLSHKKSRYGCQRCRQRRVKCNEAKPVCDNCERHRATCFYDRVPPQERCMVPAAPFPKGTAEARVAAAMARPEDAVAEPDDPPETRERRMIEVRLMHKYVTETGETVAIDDKTRFMYATLVPKLALGSDALLYCMNSLAALHIAVSSGDDREPAAVDAHRKYLSMALREHNKALANISEANADIVCLTSSLFRVCSFTLLQERPRVPYEPPVEWLMMNASTSAVVRAAYKLVGQDTQSVAYRMLHTSPIINNLEERFGEARRRGLEHIIAREPLDRDADEPWDDEIQDAYETTLSYLGGAVEAARAGEEHEVCRRLIIFPMLVKGRFIELVQEGHPRAIVLLSFYFALLSRYRHIWWIGDAGTQEVRAMAAALTGDWLAMIRWPLEVVKTGKIPPLPTDNG